ncbi:hypothetical protein [Vibrio sp. 10N.239.312.D08]|uniref:hypothetical protein n=1 Tax=Vibrio sp. 10N.239.312.D08 TaxID=3229978 RepID=UPI00354D5271
MNKHPNTKYNQINYDRSHSNDDAPKPKDHRVTYITVVTDASFALTPTYGVTAGTYV